MLIFVYYIGNWCRPNAEVVYTSEAEEINFKSRTIEIASNPNV